MGLLGVLFSANKRKWLSEMPDSMFEEEKGMIIKNFMVSDNISYEKYKANLNWESNKLSICKDKKDLANCSLSYRKYYSDDYSNRPLNNDDLGHNNVWFYLAYPDVAYWFGQNYEAIKTSLLIQGVKFGYINSEHLQVLRYVVTMYKTKFGRLETEV